MVFIYVCPGQFYTISQKTNKQINSITGSNIPPKTLFPSLLYGNVIEFSDSVKNLDVEFDQTLSWRDNVVSLSNKVFKSLYQFKKSKDCLPVSIRKLLINSLVAPLIDYCCLVNKYKIV